MILLRHGQSEFNRAFGATGRDPGIPDAPLTPLGETQAAAAAEALAADVFGFDELFGELLPPPQAAIERSAAASTEASITRLLNMVPRYLCGRPHSLTDEKYGGAGSIGSG